ncbi:MAG TPA: tetratricopeptide repeat protein [Polyangiaceae bacterium]|nr:tetratricopeptide repeat protein [Polyangiaceae bacterium]
MGKRPLTGAALAAVGLALSFARPGLALSTSEAQGRATTAIRGVEAEIGKPPTQSRFREPPATPAVRIANADMLLHAKNYDAAIDILSKVLELNRQGKASEADYADASFLISEAYFQSRQYLSARRHYREVLDRAARPAYGEYLGRSLSRLVDIALRTDDLESLDFVFARLDSLPQADKSGSLAYARAKALYARKDYNAAKSAVNSVSVGSEYTLQAQYLLGVVLMKETLASAPAPAAAAAKGAAKPSAAPDTRFTQAIEQFRKVTRMPASNAAARHVVDLAWMAIGRLFHETDDYVEAAEAYSHVDRGSPEFSTMLYELAWVYVRLGDFERAQRALEVLTITDPNNLELADGSLLRADLMLRAGAFQNALGLYKDVSGHFDPIRQQLDNFLKSTNDPAVYYDKLTTDDFGAVSDDKLPKVVLDWARDQAEDQHVFGVIDDVSRSRNLIKNSRKLASKLSAVLSVSSRVKAFPEIQVQLQQVLSLLNKLARARGTLAEGIDDVANSEVGGELATVRSERRALMKRLGWMPVTEGEFIHRDESGDTQWAKASQSLQELTVEADKLNAIVNGLHRVMNEADKHGVTSDAQSRARFQLEIDANERDLVTYHKKIEEFRTAIEVGKAQIGFGDQRYVDDEDVRKRFRELLAREVALLVAGQDSADAAAYAKSIQPLLARADNDDAALDLQRTKYEQQAIEQASVLRDKISQEIALVEGYAQKLDGLDQQARLLVGEIAMKNFSLVRDRLKSIVLRADVGIVQEAWEVREEQALRVRNLQRERAREEQTLNDELREVLDDAEEQQ